MKSQSKFDSIKTLLALIALFLSSTYVSAAPATKTYCDSLIKVGVELMLEKKHVASLELLYEAREMAARNQWHLQDFLAQNNIGNNFYLLLDYGEALHYYFASYQLATTHLQDSEKMIVLNNIAILYSKEKKYGKANMHFTKAYGLAIKYNDSLKMGLYSMNMGILANQQQQYTHARSYLNRSLRYAKNKVVQIPATIALYNTQLLSGSTKEARNFALKLLPTLKGVSNADNRMDLNVIIAKSYLSEDDLAAALRWSNASFNENPDLERKTELFALLSEIYFKLQSYAVAFQYKDSLFASQNKLHLLKNGKLYESNEVKFQVQTYKDKIKEKEHKMASDRALFYSILVGVFLAIILLLLLFRSYFIKVKQKAVWAKQAQELTEFTLEKEKAEKALLLEKEKTTLLEQDRLTNEIQLKNQRILSRALYHSGRNQLLQDLIHSFTALPNYKNNPELVTQVQALAYHLKMDDDWDNYVRHFDEVNQGFIKRLITKHPDLTTTDMRYLSYVYLNLDTKEIATLLHITPVACRKRKERIEKRLGLAAEMTLNAYLVQI
ncbi:transcriptional regulator [Flavobacterium sp. SM2513]|uniref:transcriptional regulator n=1 Tax=Flavobacterium sp. SM2513 TaxID=3424766 RepID=UPI003D7F5F82